jgi:predicted acyl esterase
LITRHEIRQNAVLIKNKFDKFRFTFAVVFIICTMLAAFSPVYSQQPAPVYTRTEAMIPMRDGVRLYTQINTPNITGENLPILFLRTPSGIGN